MMRFLIISFCLISAGVTAQVDPSIAEDLFKKRNYPGALVEYKKLLKYDREHGEWNYYAGLCYQNLNFDRKKSLPHLERAMAADKHPKETGYYLAVAYMLNYEYDKAKKVLEEYLLKPGKVVNEAKKALADCYTAPELMKNPVSVTFNNLGPGVNSEYPDYYPFVTGDEQQLAYTTRRKDKLAPIEFDGYHTSQIYFSTFDGDKFTAGKDAGTINTKYNEQCTGFTPDGEIMVMYSDYIPAGELFLVQKVSNRFEKKNRKKILEIDEPKYLESSAIISPDRNTLIYSSNRPGGYGGLDLWMLRKLPDGSWSIPQNLGPNVNTTGDEDFASFSPEGDKVFFSSNGLPGMGGYDVFEINWDSETNTWDSARNLGYPINTPDNERSISFSNDMKHAYIAADREGGLGDLDVYRLTFEDVEVNPALFLIKLKGVDPENPFVQADAFTIFNADGEVLGDYLPNPESFEYTVILNPGVYSLEGSMNGTNFKEEIKVNEFMSRMGPVIKIINIGAQP